VFSPKHSSAGELDSGFGWSVKTALFVSFCQRRFRALTGAAVSTDAAWAASTGVV
jgi:hypothetical protein